MDAMTDGLDHQVDIHVPSESRGKYDNLDTLEVRRKAPALDDTLECYESKSPNDNEVLNVDKVPARPIEEEEEFFDLSDGDTKLVQLDT
jgi:hypothetical protein